MAVIVRSYSEVSGQIAYASSVNHVIDQLFALQAGNINSANIANSGVGANNYETSSVITRALDASAVTEPKIGTSAIFPRHFNNSAVQTSCVNNQAITFDKTDYESFLAGEVFG